MRKIQNRNGIGRSYALFTLSALGAVASLTACPTQMSGLCAEGTDDCKLVDAAVTDAMADGTLGDAGDGGSPLPGHDGGRDGTVGDGSADGANDSGPGCDAGQAVCGALGCVPINTVSNCGACGTTCTAVGATPSCVTSDAGFVCSGICAAVGQNYCGDDAGCVDLKTSNANCGTCGHSCTVPTNGLTSVCASGGCGVTCVTNYHACLGNCAPNSDVPADAAVTDPCIVSDTFGVFVAPTGNDGPSTDAGTRGTQAAPYLTVAAAMKAAQGTTYKRVYACQGAYSESIAVDSTMDGVKVYGGLDCAHDWHWTGVPSAVTASPPAFALNVATISTGVEFSDFSFISSDAPQTAGVGAGASSIAAVVNSGTGPVVFRRVVFTAGRGQPGAKGADGTVWSQQATGGNNATGAGGGTVVGCTCASVPSGTGGAGGSAAIATGLSITVAATPGSDGTPLGDHNGGAGVPLDAGSSPACAPGMIGLAGDAGVGGAGALDDAGGALSPSGWSPMVVQGAAGTPGFFAQGGGGGGGYYYSSGGTLQGGGGGGGCGGCGGPNGTGGFAGGSSIALEVLTSPVTLDSCTLNGSAGGSGGAGGNGAPGQLGGDGGVSSPPGYGCVGGPGGIGGTGGAGGGGSGGHSIGVAYTGTPPTGTPVTHVATAASGGPPGSGIAAQNGQGAPGWSVGSSAF